MNYNNKYNTFASTTAFLGSLRKYKKLSEKPHFCIKKTPQYSIQSMTIINSYLFNHYGIKERRLQFDLRFEVSLTCSLWYNHQKEKCRVKIILCNFIGYCQI